MRPPLHPWQILESRAILERRWLTVHEQRVGLPQGGEIEEFHLIEAPSWVAVLADAGNHLVLVEQYRHGLGGASLELPAGVIDEGESPEEAARRELREETGYEAERFIPLAELSPEPARHTTRAFFFFASGARRVGEQNLEACEHILLRKLAADDLWEAAMSGRIAHAAHLGAVLLAERRGLWRPSVGGGRG